MTNPVSTNQNSTDLFASMHHWTLKHEVLNERHDEYLAQNEANFTTALENYENAFDSLRNNYSQYFGTEAPQRDTSLFDTELVNFAGDASNESYFDALREKNTHEVAQGETLWKITKDLYGEELSDSEIAEKVEEIAEANGIEDASSIQVGQKIDLSFLTDLDEFEKEAESFLNDFNKATYYSTTDYDLIEDGYQDAKSQLGLEFDFMQGKDANNEEEYNEQLLELARSEIAYKDIDKDGKLSAMEYAYCELHDAGLQFVDANNNGKIDEEEKSDEQKSIIANSTFFVGLMDAKTESADNDGDLSAEELADFYRLLDGYQGEGQDYVTDGKINIDLSQDYMARLLAQYSGNSEQ